MMKRKITTTLALYLILSISTTVLGFNHDIDLFPNPTQGELFIKFKTAQSSGQIIVFNFIGDKVYQEKLVANQFDYELDLMTLPKGNYFLKIIYEDGTSSTKKFSKAQ